MTFFHEIKLANGGSYWIPLEAWNFLTLEQRRILEEE